MKYLSNSEVLSGLLFFGAGLLVLGLSLNYDVGTLAAMGPGYLPRALSLVLLVIGAVVALQAYRSIRKRAAGYETIRWHPAPVLAVLGGLACFAMTIESFGLLAAAFLLVTVSGLASPDRRWKEIVMVAVLLSLSFSLVFVAGLKLPISILAWGS